MHRSEKPIVLRILGLLVAGLLASQSASAHHPMGGTVPATWWQGLLSGVAHPVIELDHLAFLIGAAVVAAICNASHWQAIRWLVGYAVAGATGTALQVFGVEVPWAEAGVIASLVGIALCLVMQSAPKLSVAALMAGAAGLVHGYAYGEAVIGAEATPLVAYLAGLALIQMALLVFVFKTVRPLLLIAPLRWQGFFRALGVLVASVAVWSGANLLA